MAEAKPKTNVKKAKAEEEKTEVEKVDEQIEALEPVPLSVERKLKHPETGAEREFIQHEMGHLTKIKFFRLLSGTVRLAAETGDSSISNIVTDAVSGVQSGTDFGSELLPTLLRLVELAPDFIEQVYIFALSVKPDEQLWAIEALEGLEDEEGFEILDVFVAQNGQALYDFFDRHLRKVAKRVSSLANEVTEQE